MITSTDLIDIKIAIPELGESFWARDCSCDDSFEQLYEDCVNRPDLIGLAHDQIPRHFWVNDRMMLRRKSLGSAADGGNARGNPSFEAILLPDYYKVGPPQYVSPAIDQYTYLDAEERIDQLMAKVVNSKEGKLCCFEVFDGKNRTLARSRTLAECGAWPSSPFVEAEDFPAYAELRLKPRTTWLPYALYVIGGIVGLMLGFLILRALLPG